MGLQDQKDGTIMADRHLYMDDNWPTGPSKKECQKVGQKVASECKHHEILDATRKWRPPSQCSQEHGQVH